MIKKIDFNDISYLHEETIPLIQKINEIIEVINNETDSKSFIKAISTLINTNDKLNNK